MARLKQLGSRIATLDTRTARPLAPVRDEGYAERQRFLNTARWRAVRDHKRRHDPLCQAKGCSRPGAAVDHWQPMRSIPPERWTERANLVHLCAEHHGIKTAAELSDRPVPFEITPTVVVEYSIA